ncbi:hypothetical protein [Cohnella terricola]|uniref:Uncharacterized protein n=1 Tax=Cohnella terricola TaxID=1289167 RepID=A0A559JDL8_9BACL|nr:hypothetical protein [Cohnella terricola]TVX97963.1 hypothetical protein FPZ45_17105 [Cohnella terricola]
MDIARLEEIIGYKKRIIELILSDPDLCKALYYGENDFLDQPELSDSAAMLYNKVFPYPFVPGTETSPGLFLTVSAGDFAKVNEIYKSGVMIVRLFAHQDSQETAYGVTRTDYAMSKVDGLLRQAKGFGLGGLKFRELNPLAVNEKYQGVNLQYQCVDFG